jgi:putative transposase
MWKAEHRRSAGRRGLRYPSDLTDAEWALVESLIPPPKHGGRKRSVNVREGLNAIFYVLSTGCQWKALPKDLPPKSTVYGYLDLWDWDGTLERIHYALYVEVRERAGREASPTTAIIDSQSAKGAAKGGASIDPSGFDAGKKVKGRKRHILVDTLGLLLNVVVHPADVQDRDGAFDLLRRSRRLFPFVERIYADGGYRGPKMAGAVARTGVWQIEIVKRPTLARFEILPKRWIVERTFAWISRCRRLAKDFERYARTTAAFVRLAMIRLMLRRLAAMPQS